MKARYFLLLLFAVFFTALLSLHKCSAESQRYFRSEAYAYSVAIPEGWKQVPDDVVNHIFNALLTEEAMKTLNYEAIFAMEWGDKELKYPYLIIQVIRYSDFGFKHRLRKDQIAYFLKALTGLDVDKEVKESVEEYISEDMRGMIHETAANIVSFDEQNMVYRFIVESEIAMVGKVNGFIVGHIGRYAAVQLMFYCLESEWSRFENERNLIFGTFHFAPGMRYEDAPSKWSDILDRLGEAVSRGLGYALIAVVLGAIFGLFKLTSILIRPRKKPKDEQQQ